MSIYILIQISEIDHKCDRFEVRFATHDDQAFRAHVGGLPDHGSYGVPTHFRLQEWKEGSMIEERILRPQPRVWSEEYPEPVIRERK